MDYSYYLSDWSCSSSIGMIVSHRCKWLAPSFPSTVFLQVFIRKKTLFLLNLITRASWGTRALLWSNLQSHGSYCWEGITFRKNYIIYSKLFSVWKSAKSISREYTDRVYVYILKNSNVHAYLKVHSKWKSFIEFF